MIDEFKDGDKVFIRWEGGNSGEYTLAKLTSNKGRVSWGVYMDTSHGQTVNFNAGEVFVDTESVELVE